MSDRTTGQPCYTVTYRTADSDTLRTQAFRAVDRFDMVAYARATAFARGINQTSGTAEYPQYQPEGNDR